MQRAGGVALFPERRRSITLRTMDAARGRSRAFSRRERRTHALFAQFPRMPCAVTVGAAAERTEAGGGELCRTATRRHICICRAVARTHKSPALHREHGCPDRDRTLEGNQHCNTHCDIQDQRRESELFDILSDVKGVSQGQSE